VTKARPWLRALLWAASVAIWVFSSGFDGRFLRTLMPVGALWGVFAYGLNFVVDVSNEMFAYVFALIQRHGRKGSKLWRWSFAMLAAQVASLYFGTVFSQAAIAEARPTLAPYLAWSAALLAQVSLLFLGVGQALLDVRSKAEPKPARPQPEPFTCETCGYIARNQHALNAHQRVHGNGQRVKAEEVRV